GLCVLTACAKPAEKENVPQENEASDTNTSKGDINKKAILVISFGTSYADTREKTIGAIENKIKEEFADYEVRRAFTSQIIIKKLKERDNIVIDNVDEALKKLQDEGFGTVICQPTHVMHGAEYDEMVDAVDNYFDKFEAIEIGNPLLSSADDYKEVISAFEKETEIDNKDTAFVLMGHGTHHFANSTYAALDYTFKDMGFDNVFVATVEGYPEFEQALKGVKAYGAKKVVLYPFMIVAGDHATNDMAGDEQDSFKTMFKKEGFEVEPVLKGLGEFSGIQDIFVTRVHDAINALSETEE
ncbi:MAG: sirohydrochlorin cobaltochelatase, partial [Oscillospiraceae bacterium]